MEVDCVRNYTFTPTSSILDSDEEFPDLESLLTPSKKHNLKENDLAYVLFGKLWWPVVCRKMYPKKRKISVIYINCEQKLPILVSASKVKRHTDLDYNLFWQQKDLIPGLKEAMLMVESFRSHATNLNMTALQFFLLSIAEQKHILNKILEDEISAEIIKSDKLCHKDSTAEFSSPSASYIHQQDDVEMDKVEELCTPKNEINPLPDISEKTLSVREIRKLKLAENTRSVRFKPLLQYMRSVACLKHLTLVAKGRFISKRHNQFLEGVGSAIPNYWAWHLTENDSGTGFFSIEDNAEHCSYINFLYEKLASKRVLKFCKSDDNRRKYIMLVLVPEAIKEVLRKKKKITEEEELENILKNGFMETATQQKARRLLFEIDF